jgi:FtsZ-binding cell division protein ZapB
MRASIRSRPSSVLGIRDGAVESTRDARDELTLKLPMLEAEVLGLRQNLAEVQANRDALRKEMDDLRRDRDHWRKLAEAGEPKLEGAGQKTWFCGRASGA